MPEQAAPDGGAFPTTPFPNPEEKRGLDLGLAFAAREGAELLIASDPDADRLSAAVATPSGRFVQLSGNQIGVCSPTSSFAARRGRRALPRSCSRAWSLRRCSGRSLARHGARFESTLTGFKWLWSAALELERERRGRFVFACEEALGYSVSPAVRDKDGISSAVLLAGIARRLRGERKTLLDRLAELYREHGLWVSVQHSAVRPGRARHRRNRVRDAAPRRRAAGRARRSARRAACETSASPAVGRVGSASPI